MRFYLSGQTNFGNRGCEALVRSITSLVREVYPDAEVLVPALDRFLDQPQWSGYENSGVKFVDTYDTPKQLIWWNRIVTRVTALKSILSPNVRLPEDIQKDILGSDVLIMTGGDVISLEYGLASLFYWSRQVDYAAQNNIKTILWAASVGPFSSDRIVERKMIEHLRRYSAITVRETESLEYLRKLGISNVRLVADPAFVLEPEKFDIVDVVPEEIGDGVVGLNISPLIAKFRETPESVELLEQDVVNFVQDVLEKTNFSVLLIPHVDPLNGDYRNSDSFYMHKLLSRMGGRSSRLGIGPASLNAAQIKFLLAQCRFFIGARTHATIGALSSYVPTISIAYSVKAKGLNKDLFDDVRYVLQTPNVSRETLWNGLQLLIQDEQLIKELLRRKIPEWKNNARFSVKILKEIIES